MKKIIFDLIKITRLDKYTDKMLEYKWEWMILSPLNMMQIME